jgi:hypothetical protein
MKTTATLARLLTAGMLLAGLGARAQTPGVAIGTPTAAASAALDVSSTTQGFLPPRLTEAQRTALGTGGIAAPDPGLLVYQTDGTQPGLWYYAASGGWTYLNPNGGSGDNLGSGVATTNIDLGSNLLVGNGGTAGLAIDNAGKVGIGTPSPSQALDLRGNLRLGADGGSVAGTGPAIEFVGPGFNTDPVGLYRFNIAADQSQLRVVVGDGSDVNDRFVVGRSSATGEGSIPAGTFTTSFTVFGNGRVGVGNVTNPLKTLHVAGPTWTTGSVFIPAANTYRYQTAKTKKYKVGVGDMRSANSSVYDARIDEGFSSATVNGLNSLWASGGTAGTVAYFIAPVHLPDSAVVTGLAAQIVKNGGSLQSVVELYRSDGTGYLSSTAQLIASCTTTSSGGGIAYVSAASVNASFNVVDNTNYAYFIRYSGEQNTQNLRFTNATITYQVYRSDY